MVAYKHERFISQAVESVMMQQTGFPVELVIGEDCSPDDTREILLQLQRQHPDHIRLLLSEKNLGMMQNFIQTLQACRGDYVALLEGDDFWISPHKLQAQADFLDAHPDCSACFTLAQVVRDANPTTAFYIPARGTPGRLFTTEELLKRNWVATCSLLFRNVVSQIPFKSLRHLPMIDWPLIILLSLRGPIAYLDSAMATYRQHEGGLWTGAREVEKLAGTLRMFDALIKELPACFAPRIKANIITLHQRIALEHLREGDRMASLLATGRSLLEIPRQSAPRYAGHLRRSVNLFLGAVARSPSGVERLLKK